MSNDYIVVYQFSCPEDKHPIIQKEIELREGNRKNSTVQVYCAFCDEKYSVEIDGTVALRNLATRVFSDCLTVAFYRRIGFKPYPTINVINAINQTIRQTIR